MDKGLNTYKSVRIYTYFLLRIIIIITNTISEWGIQTKPQTVKDKKYLLKALEVPLGATGWLHSFGFNILKYQQGCIIALRSVSTKYMG